MAEPPHHDTQQHVVTAIVISSTGTGCLSFTNNFAWPYFWQLQQGNSSKLYAVTRVSDSGLVHINTVSPRIVKAAVGKIAQGEKQRWVNEDDIIILYDVVPFQFLLLLPRLTAMQHQAAHATALHLLHRRMKSPWLLYIYSALRRNVQHVQIHTM